MYIYWVGVLFIKWIVLHHQFDNLLYIRQDGWDPFFWGRGGDGGDGGVQERCQKSCDLEKKKDMCLMNGALSYHLLIQSEWDIGQWKWVDFMSEYQLWLSWGQ